MMTRFCSVDGAARVGAAATFLAAILVANTAGVGVAAAQTLAAQADATQVRPALATNAPTQPKPNKSERVEEWIADLHNQLRITPAQSSQWDAVAEAMRENAQSVHQLIQERNRDQSTMNAIDDLRSYEQITEAREDGIKRLLPAFETLYASMSDDQKKNADVVFSKFEHPRAQKHKKS
jgi:protein CpxP